MDYQGKPQRKREGYDVVGEREEQKGKREVGEREEKEGPSHVFPPWFPSVFVYDLDVDDWDNKLDWSPRVMPPGLSAAMSMVNKGVSLNPNACDVSYKRPLDPEALKEYNRQIDESEGFDIFYYPGPSIWTPIVPLTGIKESPSYYAAVVNLAKLAINQYNVQHNEAYEFIDLERVNSRVVSGSIYYITFQVKNLKAAGNGYDDGTPLETFQARVWEGITKTEVHFCRPKPIKPQN